MSSTFCFRLFRPKGRTTAVKRPLNFVRSPRFVVSEHKDLKKVLYFWRPLLSRQDWVYVLSLLIPFVAYNLVLKALILSSRNVASVGQFKDSTLRLLVYGMWSDVFFVIGYALLWIGLFTVARKMPLRWGVLVLF